MALYNGGFPATYPQYYPQYQQTYQQTNNSGIIWVQGEAGAKSYLVAPNTTVQLWDSEEKVIYLKTSDCSGMPSMKILDYTIRENAQKLPSDGFPSQVDKSSTFVTKAEIDGILSQIDALKAELNKLKEVEHE